MLNQPCIPEINPSQSWHTVLSKHCWIWFVNIFWGFLNLCSWVISVGSFVYFSYFCLSLDVVILVSDIYLGKFSVMLKKSFLSSLLSLISSCYTHYVYVIAFLVVWLFCCVDFFPAHFLFSFEIWRFLLICLQAQRYLSSVSSLAAKQNIRNLVVHKQQYSFLIVTEAEKFKNKLPTDSVSGEGPISGS